MPRKIRELKKILKSIGFTETPGKGSHTNWIHPLFMGRVTLSGKDGSDAKKYHEKQVETAIEEVRRKQNDQ